MRKLVVAAIILGMSVRAAAQEQGATLYSKAHFAGPKVTIDGPTTHMMPFVVKSLRIAPGAVWDLCSGNTFTGCERYSESKAALVRTVRSVRPVAPPIPESVTISSGAQVSGTGPSLHGLASEFFVLPATAGSRVEVTDKAAGAEIQAASAFCRDHGWRTSVHERLQTVGGRTFLADVLCVNEDR